MNSEKQLIDAIASNITEVNKTLSAIKDALEDGEALAYLGATDQDQEIVEDAHALVTEWMDKGIEFYGAE